MKFKKRNLREIAEMVIGDKVVGDKKIFPYRKGREITQFFEECELDFVHDGSGRWAWTADRLAELLQEPKPADHVLPERFVRVLQVLMHKSDATPDDPNRSQSLDALNRPLSREGYKAFYGEDDILYIRQIGTKTISTAANSHRPFTPEETERRKQIIEYLDKCSEDELINEILLPLFRQIGFERITATDHKDKALEYGKDIWMRYKLPTEHFLYFGVQVKKGKIDASGVSRNRNTNIAELHQQILMMLGHEIFDPETNRKVLVDHAFIIAGGEITKQAKNWLGEKLDASKRSQILFMNREDIINLYIVNSLPLPDGTISKPL